MTLETKLANLGSEMQWNSYVQLSITVPLHLKPRLGRGLLVFLSFAHILSCFASNFMVCYSVPSPTILSSPSHSNCKVTFVFYRSKFFSCARESLGHRSFTFRTPGG
jgi:hypothetical protein